MPRIDALVPQSSPVGLPSSTVGFPHRASMQVRCPFGSTHVNRHLRRSRVASGPSGSHRGGQHRPLVQMGHRTRRGGYAPGPLDLSVADLGLVLAVSPHLDDAVLAPEACSRVPWCHCADRIRRHPSGVPEAAHAMGSVLRFRGGYRRSR